MRNDYFTLSQLARVVHADPQRLKRIMDSYEDFPVKRVGGQYVIPKNQFFNWYDTHKNDDDLRYRFSDASIEDSRTEYVMFRNETRLHRRFAM